MARGNKAHPLGLDESIITIEKYTRAIIEGLCTLACCVHMQAYIASDTAAVVHEDE